MNMPEEKSSPFDKKDLLEALAPERMVEAISKIKNLQPKKGVDLVALASKLIIRRKNKK